MENRMISYGYEIKNGRVSILPFEASIVKRIFEEYKNGKGLKRIAEELTEEKVVYFKENYQWNKNRILRILENKKYIGENDYPPILDRNEYEQTLTKKTEKGFQKKSLNEAIKHLKEITYCKQCGSLLYRHPTWHIKERWICKHKCKIENYIDDNEILSSLFKAIKKVTLQPQLLSISSHITTYQPNLEITKYNYEINRITNEKEINFDLAKKTILKCAKLKFSQCIEDISNVYKSFSIQDVDSAMQITKEYLETTITKLEIEQSGTLVVTFLNGVSLSSEE